MSFEGLRKHIVNLLELRTDRTTQSPAEIALNEYFLAESFVALILILALLIIAKVMNAPIMEEYCISLLLVGGSMSFLAAIYFKKVEHTILLQQLITIAIVTFYTAKMGGLLTSGGIIILGAAPVLKTLVFKQFRKMIAVYILFLLSLIFLAISDPVLTGKDLLTPGQNKFFFALNFTVIISYIFLFAGYVQRMFTKLERREALRQKEMNEAKTRLYANMTHEFRTPLTVILGMADALKSNTENAYAKADSIARNGKKLLQLVDQLLDFSKLEAGGMKVNNVHGNIISFLRYIFQLQEYYARGKNIQFIFESESQSYELDFDPEKISAIISNLLSNAIKFTPEGGKIKLEVSRVGNYLVIEIIDNGIGIAPENQAKIFERFYQVDESSTRKNEGTGIGLALTKELVSLLKGSISVASNPGLETVFVVKIPIEAKAKKLFRLDDIELSESQESVEIPGAELLNNKHSRQDYNLLVIEDNPDVLSYIKSCYQNQFKIEVAFNGLQGLKLAIETIPDIIISDVMMPELDGFQLCNKLKNDYRTSHIPIILLTAKADLESRIEGLDQGADAYVVKPFNQRELLVRINKLLELRRKLCERYADGALPTDAASAYLRREDQFIKKVTACVRKNLSDENFDVHTLCGEMAMSKSQLYRKFKALTDMSAAKYIRKLRMHRARHLLLTTSMNITEISYEVGIKTLSTFSEIFKDEFGQSPSEYQDQFNGNLRKN